MIISHLPLIYVTETISDEMQRSADYGVFRGRRSMYVFRRMIDSE